MKKNKPMQQKIQSQLAIIFWVLLFMGMITGGFLSLIYTAISRNTNEIQEQTKIESEISSEIDLLLRSSFEDCRKVMVDGVNKSNKNCIFYKKQNEK